MSDQFDWIERNHYVAAVVLLGLEELKSKGLVVGGFDIDIPSLQQIKARAEMEGFVPPTKDEIAAFTQYLSRGGGAEKDFEEWQ
jgi:hypothetical protein